MGFGTFGSDASGVVPAGGDFGAFGTAGGTSGEAHNAPAGVVGDSGSGNGVVGLSNSGVGTGGASFSGIGVSGRTDVGVAVEASGRDGIGLHAFVNTGAIAGFFEGGVNISGQLFVREDVTVGGSGSTATLHASNVDANVKQFRIDHPVDPANKYLCHCSVESPDMMNIYNGNVALDAGGEVVVELPAWFEALNQDFRYQLTAVGAPGPNLYVAEKIRGGRFKIAGGLAGMEVSWQVTGVRHDAYAIAHRVQVEQEKPEAERGCYLHPELFGEPAERSIEWASQDRLRRMRANRAGTHPDLHGPALRDERSAAAHEAS